MISNVIINNIDIPFRKTVYNTFIIMSSAKFNITRHYTIVD